MISSTFNIATILLVASVWAVDPMHDPNEPILPEPIDFPRLHTEINPRDAAENGYFDYTYVYERDGSHHDRRRGNSGGRRKSSHHEEHHHPENPMAIVNGVDYHPEPAPEPDCTSFIPAPLPCESSTTPTPVPCSSSSSSSATGTPLPTSASSTPVPTPLPTSAATSSGCPAPSTVTKTVLADACTTLIICNPARTDCPNAAVASEVAKVIFEKGGAATVNGTKVNVVSGSSGNAKTVVVSGSTVVQISGAQANAAAANVNFGFEGGFLLAAIIGVIGAIIAL